jgi:hypothetical protein
MYFGADPNKDKRFRSLSGTYRHELDPGRFILVNDNGDGTGEFATDPLCDCNPFPQAPLTHKYRWREMRPNWL